MRLSGEQDNNNNYLDCGGEGLGAGVHHTVTLRGGVMNITSLIVFDPQSSLFPNIAAGEVSRVH